MPTRYGIRLVDGLIPKAEVTVPSLASSNPWTWRHDVVKTRYGFTTTHAWNRALRWTRDHGDPR